MTRAQEQMAPTVENNAILSLLIDGPKTARELYALSGLNGQTGRELGRLMQAGQIVKMTADTFKLPGISAEFPLSRLPQPRPSDRQVIALAGLVADLLQDIDTDPPAPRRDWTNQ